MAINIEQIKEIYQDQSIDHYSWIVIPDSKQGDINPEAIGSSGGETGNSWKIHISIDPSKMAEASAIICNLLNDKNSPHVSIKFANDVMAATGQPSKQVAFSLYAEEMGNLNNIRNFLHNIDIALSTANIGVDPRPINSDEEQASRKYDANIPNEDGSLTRFNYRFSEGIVFKDDCYDDYAQSTGQNITQEGIFYYIRQSYFISLPDDKKHNPANLPDPFAKLRLNLKPNDNSNVDDNMQNNPPVISQASSAAPATNHNTNNNENPKPTQKSMPLGLKILLGVLIALTFPISLPIFFYAQYKMKQKAQQVTGIHVPSKSIEWTQPSSSRFKPCSQLSVRVNTSHASSNYKEQSVSLETSTLRANY